MDARIVTATNGEVEYDYVELAGAVKEIATKTLRHDFGSIDTTQSRVARCPVGDGSTGLDGTTPA